MPVPLLDVNAQNLPLAAELQATFDRVLRSGRFILGGEVEAFEAECAALVGTNHALAVSSGTDALIVALMALGIGPGDEVLVPTFTFFATAGSVHRVGATPVFVDACPVCFNLDTTKAAAKITARTKAIIPVHLFGQAADMDAVMDLARANHLHVIEDAAQALGARTRGHGCGTIGKFGCFSFFPSKNLGGFGDGGLVTTNDPVLAARAGQLRNHGMHPKYCHPRVGGNFRMDALQCALLRVKLRHHATYNAGRRANAAEYTARLSALTGVVRANPAHCQCDAAQQSAFADRDVRLVLPIAYLHNEHIWNQYTVRVPGAGRRDALRDHLAAAGIGCEIYYPLTMDQQECFASLPEHARADCAVARRLAAEVLSIPVYPELTDDQKDEVVAAIAAFPA
jgi:dTDP-4-amino-4,6-dideoxygalactose transaminase